MVPFTPFRNKIVRAMKSLIVSVCSFSTAMIPIFWVQYSCGMFIIVNKSYDMTNFLSHVEAELWIITQDLFSV